MLFGIPNEAFSEARKALNSEEKTGSAGENIIMQDNFVSVNI